ncbi:cytochrome c [Roseinatronobacter sp. S2]|uniref:cytochrome c n=1 Tax=Roseinatronobacter sp. S2 TaxID=3035471 RepID=UPI00240F946B|nr:cytochrome c [Roseinatronobacter sp. S2]WFE76585.1 cytochrome c [Roseinatronobacter sp. S2]
MKGSIWAVAQTGVPVAAILLAATALAEPDDSGDPNAAHGEYVARAAGCMSCHQEDLSGGYRVETPMGTIVASNISPSQDYGIGGYSRDDLANVLRRGVAPDRRLYPAMPYASYRGMTDADIDALYLWLMEQDAVDEAPENETDLPFPFNIRTGVIAWNWLYLDDRDLPRHDDPVLARGAYLVNHLGHCGECHTPRNDFFAMQDDLYLAGEVIDGWLAPNLTSDPVSGIGEWSGQDIIDYLSKGHAGNVVQAAGPMAEFVQHGTSHLEEGDLAAIAAYLKTIPPIASGIQDVPVIPPEGERVTPQHQYHQIRIEMATAMAREDLTEPEQLYLDHCAACHGVTGQGQPQAYYPPLNQNAALRRADTTNLLQVLLHGVPAGKLARAPAMPGFADEFSDAQIAMIANYTRATFGGRQDSALTAAHVTSIREDEEEMPAPLRILQLAAWAGLIGALALIVAGTMFFWWRARLRGFKRQES